MLFFYFLIGVKSGYFNEILEFLKEKLFLLLDMFNFFIDRSRGEIIKVIMKIMFLINFY